MSDTTQDQLQFLENSKPRIEAGTYRVVVTQDLEPVAGQRKTFSSQSFDFAVFGERFRLSADAIHTVFPPAGSIGRRTDVLPHICIHRVTFPWERSAHGGELHEPWVALLLFEDKEFAKEDVVKQIVEAAKLETQPVKLADGTTAPRPPSFPEIDLETPGQSSDDLVTVIDVKRRLLEKILPTGKELKLLAHVRRRQSTSRDLAVVMGNRLPRAGSDSVMHLVSLEERYDDNGQTFNYQSAGPEDYIRLVSLASWSFGSVPEIGKDFEELVEDLDTGVLTLPARDGTTTAERDAHTYLSRGFVPVPHKLRQCATTYSWYHGPFVPYAKGTRFALDAHLPRFADGLVQYDPELGMFDASHAAAFELGRVLALEDRSFSAALYRWKLRKNEEQKAAEQESSKGLVARPARSTDTNKQESSEEPDQPDPIEAKLRSWLDERTLLEHIPFNYLVPAERMLPAESIRFFQLDWHWIECLLYGAFTVGGYTRELESDTTDLLNKFSSLASKLYGSSKPTSGFLLRSRLVADYPDLRVDVYSGTSSKTTDPDPSTLLVQHRLAYLGKDVLLCLCSGAVRTTELHLEPEGLRFGLDEEENEGLVLDLPMDETTTGASPDIALIQNAQVNQGGQHADGSTFGDCFQFADKAYVGLHYPNVLRSPSTRSFTSAFWMKASDLSSQATGSRIFDATWDENNFIQWVVVGVDSVQLSMKVDGTAHVSKPIALSAGVWYHVAGVWDALAKENKLRVYVNGEAVTTQGVGLASNKAGLSDGPGKNRCCDIGRRSDEKLHFTGSLARFHLYDRALADGEVKALMTVTKMPRALLVLPLDEATYGHLHHAIDKIGGAELVPDTDKAYCMEFNGKSSYIKLRYLPEILDDLPTGDFTIALWINARSLAPMTPWTCLLDATRDADNFVLLSVPERDKIQLTVRKGGTRYQKKTTAISTGSWHHIAITWRHSTSATSLFVDGKEATDAGAGEPACGGSPCLELGRRSDGQGHFEGQMAYVRVYGRALTAEQVKAIQQVDQICINTKRYEKELIGQGSPVKVGMSAPVRSGGKRVLKITNDEKTGVADEIRKALALPTDLNAGQFGMYMMEGSNKARIVKKA